MLISCPECDAGYEVPDALLRNARMMRCAACGHDWMTEPLEEAADMAPAGNGARPAMPPAAPAARPSAAGGPVTQQISCPNCAAIYDIPAVMLTSPRSMRCASCGQDWVTSPPAGEAPAPPASVAPLANPPPPPPPPPAAESAPAAPQPMAATEPPPPAGLPIEPPAAAEAPRPEPYVAEPYAAEPDPASQALSPDELAELEAVRAAQATSQEVAPPDITPPGSFRDRLQDGLRTNAAALLGWAATIVLLYLAASSAVAHRSALVQLWPPGERVFNWLGIS